MAEIALRQRHHDDCGSVGVTGWRDDFPGRKRKTPALVAGVGPRRENLGVVLVDSN